MNEVENMYKNTEIELNEGLEWVCKNPDNCTYQNLSIVPENCSGCEYFEREKVYPPFTAEKQIKLIKWMIKTTHKHLLQNIVVECFSESLAGILNTYWSSLTEEERKQIKNILE